MQRSVNPLNTSALSSQHYWSTGGYATTTMLTILTLTLICHYFYTNHTQFAKHTAHDSNYNDIRNFLSNSHVLKHAFRASTLLVGRQEGHTACKNYVIGCWCGYLSGAMCRLFRYDT